MPGQPAPTLPACREDTMPSKGGPNSKQAKFMRAACHSEKIRKEHGISKQAACEWMKEDQKRKERAHKAGVKERF